MFVCRCTDDVFDVYIGMKWCDEGAFILSNVARSTYTLSDSSTYPLKAVYRVRPQGWVVLRGAEVPPPCSGPPKKRVLLGKQRCPKMPEVRATRKDGNDTKPSGKRSAVVQSRNEEV